MATKKPKTKSRSHRPATRAKSVRPILRIMPRKRLPLTHQICRWIGEAYVAMLPALRNDPHPHVCLEIESGDLRGDRIPFPVLRAVSMMEFMLTAWIPIVPTEKNGHREADRIEIRMVAASQLGRIRGQRKRYKLWLKLPAEAPDKMSDNTTALLTLFSRSQRLNRHFCQDIMEIAARHPDDPKIVRSVTCPNGSFQPSRLPRPGEVLKPKDGEVLEMQPGQVLAHLTGDGPTTADPEAIEFDLSEEDAIPIDLSDLEDAYLEFELA